MTTYAGFVANLGDLSITGVNRQNDEPPTSLNSADLPCQWVQFPVGEENALTLGTHGGWPTFSGQLIVAYEAVALNTQPANWSGTVTLMDTVATALQLAIKTVVEGKLTWIINPGIVTVGEHDYWAVIADVTGHG